jgi:hypothetical protein
VSALGRAACQAAWPCFHVWEPNDVKVLILTTFDLGQYVYAAHMSAATAKTHVSRLLKKLAARDRAQLVVVAYESELARSPAGSGENATRRPSRS